MTPLQKHSLKFGKSPNVMKFKDNVEYEAWRMKSSQS